MPDKQCSQSEQLVEDLNKSLKYHKGYIAIGLDMAASESNWGICVLTINEDMNSGGLKLLLPQAKINKDKSISPTLYCRPSFDTLKAILQSITDNNLSGSMGVDVPFGWPIEHESFLEEWSANNGWEAGDTLPERADFEKRLCDLELNKYEKTIEPFAVGADTIAQAAYAWASCRTKLSNLVGNIDLGLDDCKLSGIRTFESYPGAFVKLMHPKYGDYKSKPDVRNELFLEVIQKYNIECDEQATGWLEWAINQKGKSPDAFDALLCAITAWGYLRWKNDPETFPITTPELLLGKSLSDSQLLRIQKEGWIMIPAKKTI